MFAVLLREYTYNNLLQIIKFKQAIINMSLWVRTDMLCDLPLRNNVEGKRLNFVAIFSDFARQLSIKSDGLCIPHIL